MDTLEFLSKYNPSNAGSEDEVRSKFIIPLFRTLGFTDEVRGENYPVYYNEGRSVKQPMKADFIYFSSDDHVVQRENTEWAKNYSLVVVEAKNINESLNNEGQPTFYAMWTRTPYYVLTNGICFRVFQIHPFSSDDLVLDCKTIAELKESIPELQRILHPDAIKEYCESNSIKSFNFPETNYKNYLEQILVILKKELSFHVERKVSNLFQTTISSQNLARNITKASVEEIILQNQSFTILGEPGSGKTWLTYLIAIEQVKSLSNSEINRVPIIIEAKYFGNNFKTITQAIEQVLNWYLPSITQTIIKDDIRNGKYLLIIDGFDEIKIQKTSLIGEILEIVKNTESKVIVTCRDQQYHNEYDSYLSVCKIDHLSKEQIVTYLNQYIGNGNHIYFQMGNTLKNLVDRPLFLKMTTEAILNTENMRLPKNVSTLFMSYSDMILHRWEKSKGLDIDSEISTKTKRIVLQEYAFRIFSSTPDEKLFDEIISTHSTIYAPLTVRKALLRSGIILERYNGPDFFHRSFLEFFYAEKLQGETRENLIEIIKLNCNNEEYYEIFQYLSGLLNNKEKQNCVLDCLEELNLDLYWKCLNVRFRDENSNNREDLNWSAETYLSQLRDSYIKILSSHFSTIIPLIDPWRTAGKNARAINEICIEGALNFDIPSINFSLFIPSISETNKVIITESPVQPTLTVLKPNNEKHDSDTIISLSMPIDGGYHYHNLKLSNLGIDSAREIAFKKIKSQLYDLLDKNILIVKETYPMILETMEKIFYDLRYEQLPIPEPLRKLSLHNNLEETLKIVKDYKDFNGIKFADNFILPIDFPEIYLLLNEIKDRDNVVQCLLPSADLDFNDLGKNNAFNWELYSKDQLKNYFYKLFDWFQDGYRLLVENLFPTLKNKMNLYCCGPVRYSINVLLNYQSPFRSGTYISWEPVSVDEDKSTIVTIIEDKQSHSHFSQTEYEQLTHKLELLGRFPKSIPYGQSSLLTIYFDNQQILRKKVYEQVKNDLKQIIGDNH